MTEKRFGIGKIECENDYDIWYVDKICDNGRVLSDNEIVKLLNELHEENQKCKEYNGKLYANHTKNDRELLKQISELKKENEQLKKQLRELENDSTKSRNDREKNCGYCKNYNLDGMFGIWCSIHETPTSDKYCQDFEWNR